MDATPTPLHSPAPRRLALPRLCELCRRWSTEGLCSACAGRWASPQPRCMRCGLRTGVALDACGECLRDPPPFLRCSVVADYGHPWDRLLASFKFHRHAELARALAVPMARAWRAAQPPDAAARPDVLVPVPSGPQRLRERGFNPAWELARHLARPLGAPARADLLERVTEAAHQAESNRAQRLGNLRAAFVVPRGAVSTLAGAQVLLVDDVMTTGATAREASAVLLRAGAARVDVLVFARTPSPGE